MNKKKWFIFIIIVSIIILLLMLRFIYFIKDIKDRNTYYEVREYNVPNDYINEFGNISLPNRWDIKKVNNWYILYDNKTNKDLAYQIYKGYEIQKDEDYVFEEYIENPIVLEYNYYNLHFEFKAPNQYASYGKVDNYVKMTFYKYVDNKRYSTSFLAIDVIDFYKYEWVTGTFKN